MNYDYEILSRWGHLYPSLQLSGQEMLARVEAALTARQIPDAQLSRVPWKEGGVLSAEREYLRVKRRGYAVDICAAPFGSGFFFSSWLTEAAPRVGCLVLLALVAALAFVTRGLLHARFWFSHAFGTISGEPMLAPYRVGIVYGGELLALVLLFVLASQDPTIEEFVRGLPGIGWVYDRLFRPATFYRIDTGLAFHEAVHGALLTVIDQVTDEKGLPRLTDAERRPIHRELSKLR